MKNLTVKLLCLLILNVTLITADYWADRERLIRSDIAHYIGSKIHLTERESKANEILMSVKLKDFDEGFRDPEKFLAAQHFFRAKNDIEKSKVFKIIKRMPKGASLHSHDMALVSQEYLFNLTYRDDLYGCTINGLFILNFLNRTIIPKDCNWTLLSRLRDEDPKFDQYLKSKLTLVVDDPSNFYPTINSVWTSFMDIFTTVAGVITYKPIWKEYFYQALKELYEDNVRYLEFRGILPQVYDLLGHTYKDEEVVGLYYDTLKQFKHDYPDFIGARFVYAPRRLVTNQTFDHYVDIFIKLRELYPDFVIGFDLVGQEDLGHPQTAFISQLLKMKNLGAKFFFHAGETNWYGESSDFNLFDAVLLNTTRIGHGYAILKHPEIAKIVKSRKIAVEISPISNQVLKLVDDMRNHPASIMIADNFPVVITCDDPSFWGAKGLSHDWYMAFMGMASRESDLRFLKQIAMNSFVYSSMEESERNAALSQWQEDWDKFIDSLLRTYNTVP